MAIIENRSRKILVWTLVALLLLVFAVLESSAIPRTAPTVDEVAHLPKGYTMLVSGELRMGRETPVLAPAIASLPLLKYDLTIPVNSKSYRDLNQYRYGQMFLYQNKISAEKIINTGRQAIVVLGIVLGLAVFLIGYRLFGAVAGLASLGFYVLEPNILAQGDLVTVEITFALTFLLALVAFMAYLNKPTMWKLVICGTAVGAALATKHSSILLFVILLVLLVWQYLKSDRTKRYWAKDILLPLAVISIVSYLVIIAVYMGNVHPLIDPLDPAGENLSSLQTRLPRDGSLLSRIVYWGLEDLPLPAADWLRGLAFQLLHAGKGHPAYLLGQYSEQGWWYYFPVALAVKTNMAFFMLALIGAYLWFKQSLSGTVKATIPLAAAVLLLIHMLGNIDIGVRYLMPLFPIMAIFAGSVFRAPFRGRSLILGLALLWMAYGVYSVYPHYLTYFNEIAGGPRGGIRVLADSNLDWGQGLYDLRDWQKRNHVRQLRHSYFGAALPSKHGIIGREMTKKEKFTPGPGIYAISATNLLAVFEPDKAAFGFFRKLKPDAVIANVIYIYKINKSGHE